MKITVEISDALLRDARSVAARHGLTLRPLIERGLSLAIAETRRDTPFKLRRASFKGKGWQEEVRGASWAKIRDRAYENRGV